MSATLPAAKAPAEPLQRAAWWSGVAAAPTAALLLPVEAEDPGPIVLNPSAQLLFARLDPTLVDREHLPPTHGFAAELRDAATGAQQRVSRGLTHAVTLAGETLELRCGFVEDGRAWLLWLQSPGAMANASDPNLGLVVQHSGHMVVLTDSEGCIEWVNAAFSRVTGFSLPEALGHKPGALLQGPGTRPETVALMRRHLARQEAVPRTEVLNYAKDKRTYWIELEIQPVRDAAGRVTGFLSVQTDVTERKAREEMLVELSHRLDLALSATSIGLWESDLVTGESRYFGPTAKVLGLPPTQPPLSLAAFAERVHPDDRAVVEAANDARLESGSAIDVEFRWRGFDDKWRHLHSRARVVDRETGRPRVVGVMQDVSWRKLAEARMLALTDRLRLAGAAGRLGFFERNLETGEAHWDDVCYALFEREPSLGPPSLAEGLEQIDPRDRDMVRDHMAEMAHSGGEFAIEYRVLLKSGRVRYIDSRGLGTEVGGRRVMGVLIDVTEQREAAAANRALNERLTLAIRSGGIGIWDLHLSTNTVVWNDEMYAIYGLDHSETPFTFEPWLASVHPEDRERARERAETFFRDGGQYNDTFRIVRRDGQVRHIETEAIAQTDDRGAVVRVVGTYRDVTALREADRQLARLNDRLQLAAEVTGLGIWEVDFANHTEHWDMRTCAMFGIESEGPNVPWDRWLELVHPEDRAATIAATDAARSQGRVGMMSYRIVRPDGEVRHIESRYLIQRDAEGRPLRTVGTALDVTAQREAARERERLLKRLQVASDAAQLGIWEMDVASGEEMWDERACRLFGVGDGPRLAAPGAFLALVHPDDRAMLTEQMQAHLERGDRSGTLQFRLRRPDGVVRDILANFIIERDAAGKALRVIGADLDITDQHRVERELRDAHHRLEIAAQSARIGVFEIDLQVGMAHWDGRNAAIYGLGDAPMRISIERWLAHLHREDREEQYRKFSRAIEGGLQAEQHSYRIVRADGQEREVISGYLIERDEAGKPLRVVGTTTDVTELRAAERAARISAERLQVATEVARIGVFERDAEDHLVYCDSSIYELFDLPAGEAAPAAAWYARVLPEDRDVYTRGRIEARTTDAPVRTEYRVRHRSGEVRDVLTWKRRRLNSSGRYAGEIGVAMDVTELRTAERRATEAAAQLSLAQKSAGMGVWEWDIAGGRVLWDEQSFDLFGLPTSADSTVAFSEFRDRIHPGDVDRLQREIADACERGRPYDTQFRVITPSGQTRLLASRAEVQRDAAKRPQRMIGINWDITERHAAEALARETTERLQLATQAAGIGIWDRDLVNDILLWDERMYALFGRDPGDGATPAQIWRSGVHPEDRPLIQAAQRRAFEERSSYAAEFRVLRPNGEVRWLAARGVVRYDEQGKPQRLLGVNWDVSEAKLADAALRAKETAERASQAKSEFLSRMSHELRTPLNAILGFTQMLEMDSGDPPTIGQRERLTLIRNAGWHLLHLINDVLDLARIEAGRASVSMEVVAWRDVLDEVLGMLQPEAVQRNVALEVSIAPATPPTLWADRTRLRQVLLNLLSNAIKYNRPDGSVRLSASGLAGESVKLAVRDTGRGLTRAQIDSLFQPFNRLGMEASGTDGTGIGLAISQRLVQQMQGTLEVESELGVGSEFRVTFRAATVEEADTTIGDIAAQPLPLESREDVAGTVLYIEDNPANSALVEQFLQFRPRVRLFKAADGATGLVMAAVCQPDLILIDMRLPDLQGDEVLQQLRLQPETAHITCVGVSANAMPHDIALAKQAGFYDYWTKPLDANRFLDGVDRLLEAARSPAAKS